jgi:predicted dehydrogenase
MSAGSSGPGGTGILPVSRAKRKRYLIVGLGARAELFVRAILNDYADRAELVGLCDVNRTRMEYYNRRFVSAGGAAPLPTFTPDQFDHALAEQRADCVIVTSVDRTHHRYTLRAMELGCDVITEKPMTIDAPRCQALLDGVRRTGRKLTVAFNYRYAPRNSQVRELLAAGVIGRVLSVHFEWLLDTRHGADYFRRWHRDKRNSGGLMVHKATHHFDLVNWWIGSVPQTVFGFGGLKFYGRENAEERGEWRLYDRVHGRPQAQDDPFALHLQQHDDLRELYLKAEHEDGYLRDQSVFGDGISIEDDMAVLVRYASGATLSYHLTAYAPWEGYRVMFNGTQGRLELEVEENSYVRGFEAAAPRSAVSGTTVERETLARLLVRPHWRKAIEVALPQDSADGHAGGDARLLAAIFAGGAEPDPLERAATHIDGAYSILTGIAANQSFATGRPVDVRNLVTF